MKTSGHESEQRCPLILSTVQKNYNVKYQDLNFTTVGENRTVHYLVFISYVFFSLHAHQTVFNTSEQLVSC